HLVSEARVEEAVLEDQAGVGGEDEVRQTRLRRHQLDRDAEADERVVQPPPLGAGPLRRAAALDLHPRTDLVFEAVVLGGALQISWLAHTPCSGVGGRRFLPLLSLWYAGATR